MKKILLLLLFLILLSTVKALSQDYDTVFVNKIYISYYSFHYKNPIMIKYRLYKGGGDCDRSQFHFNNDHLKHKTATPSDYLHSGYDEGHLANAEDFAYNCNLEELTFKFWNCVPQTPELNRGIWKTQEEEIRNLSEKDSLIILCGAFFDKNKKIGEAVYIPTHCWKVIYDLKTKQIVNCSVFTNSSSPTRKDYDINSFRKLVLEHYHGIDINKFLK